MYQEMTHDINGTHKYPSWPIKFSGERIQHRSSAPILGQHNEYVLSQILNLSEKEIEALEDEKIIGSIPLGAMV